MAYTTEKTYTQSGSTNRDFIVTFPFLATTDLRVQLNGTTKSITSDYTIVQSGGTTTINFNTAPANNDTIRLYRETDIDEIDRTYQAGSSIRAQDLNTNNTQLLYACQEFGKITATGTSVLTTGSKGDITVNSTSDWVINSDVVEAGMMADNAIETAAIKDEAVTADKIAPGALSNISVADNSITAPKLTSNSVISAKITDLNVIESKLGTESVTPTKLKQTTESGLGFVPVGTVIFYGGTSAPTGFLKCNGDAIPNGTGTVQSVSSNYAALYAVVGGNVPDLRGYFVRGWVDNGSVDSGRSIRTSQTAQNESHTHNATSTSSVSDPGHHHNYVKRNGTQNVDWDAHHPVAHKDEVDADTSTSTTGITVSTSTTLATQGGTEARPVNVALLACIKY